MFLNTKWLSISQIDQLLLSVCHRLAGTYISLSSPGNSGVKLKFTQVVKPNVPSDSSEFLVLQFQM